MSNTFFNPVSQCVTGEHYDESVPAERPVFHKELGTYFRGIRESRRLKLRQAAMLASERGLTHLTKNVLHNLEHGLTKDIEPDVLRDISKLYSCNYDALVERVVADRYGVPGATPPQQAGTDAIEALRWLDALEESDVADVQALSAIPQASREKLLAVVRLVADLYQGREARGSTSGRGSAKSRAANTTKGQGRHR